MLPKCVCVCVRAYVCVYEHSCVCVCVCINVMKKIAKGHNKWHSHCRDLRRELPSSIESFQFWDAQFLGKAHWRSAAGSPSCSHSHLTKCMVLFPPPSPFSFTHSCHVSLLWCTATLWKTRTPIYTFDLTSLLVVVSLHKEMLQSSAKMFSHASSLQPKQILNKCNFLLKPSAITHPEWKQCLEVTLYCTAVLCRHVQCLMRFNIL